MADKSVFGNDASDFRLEEYFPAVKNEAASYGLHVDVEENQSKVRGRHTSCSGSRV